MKSKKIAVVGGGFTGLTAAYELSRKGYEVSIFERGPELGGLASGFTIEGTSLEKTYHHLFKTDRSIIDFLSELGLQDALLWRPSSMSLFAEGALYSFSSATDLLRFSPLTFLNRIRAGLVLLYLQKTNVWRQFIPISAYAWMRQIAGEQVTRVLWKPLLEGKFHSYYDKVSMAWLWARVHTRANSRSFGQQELLGYIRGGFITVVERLLSRMREHNVRIVTSVLVEEIREGALTYTTGSSRTTEPFDAIIVTTPSSVFAKLATASLPRDYIENLVSIPYLGAACMVFTSTQSLSRYYWHNVNDTTFPFLVFLEHTNLIEKSTYGGMHVYYIGSYVPHDHRYFSMTEDEVRALWFSGVKRLFPHFNEATVKECHLFRLKNAQHVVDCDYETKIVPHETPIPSVYLANFSQIFPEDRGTNFAVRDGKKIAELVIAKHPMADEK